MTRSATTPPRLSESTKSFLRRIRQQIGDEKPYPDLGFHLESRDGLERYEVKIYPSGQVIYHFLRKARGKKNPLWCRRYISKIRTAPGQAHEILFRSLQAKLARNSAKRDPSSDQIPLI